MRFFTTQKRREKPVVPFGVSGHFRVEAKHKTSVQRRELGATGVFHSGGNGQCVPLHRILQGIFHTVFHSTERGFPVLGALQGNSGECRPGEGIVPEGDLDRITAIRRIGHRGNDAVIRIDGDLHGSPGSTEQNRSGGSGFGFRRTECGRQRQQKGGKECDVCFHRCEFVHGAIASCCLLHRHLHNGEGMGRQIAYAIRET